MIAAKSGAKLEGSKPLSRYPVVPKLKESVPPPPTPDPGGGRQGAVGEDPVRRTAGQVSIDPEDDLQRSLIHLAARQDVFIYDRTHAAWERTAALGVKTEWCQRQLPSKNLFSSLCGFLHVGDGPGEWRGGGGGLQ